MRVWHFSEMPYTPAWTCEEDTLRVTLPNSFYDPKLGHEIYKRQFDNYLLADELGFDLMSNEHHSTATCLQTTTPLIMSILARETKNARLLTLGNPLANRPDPVRVAEEMAVIDNISGGRLEVGFIRGTPAELSAVNASPARMVERMWEAHDLILKAWTTHDGPFNWEGEFFHHRQVNIWPRPYQSPRPPVWVTVGSPSSAIRAADEGHVIATLLGGHSSRGAFDAYRQRTAELGRPAPKSDRFGYLALVAVGETDEAGRELARLMVPHLDVSLWMPQQFLNPPGYANVAANVAAMKRAGSGSLSAHQQVASNEGDAVMKGKALPSRDTVDRAIERAILFAGSPDTVRKQITEFSESMGGIGHLLMLGHAGYMDFDAHATNIRLFGKEVLPALRELPEPEVAPRDVDDDQLLRNALP
jgi:alkanesulfonate monooxygenase SsuD/methylene tetrahydromethanopterin reductase-like flavin-dependent oxidoreductase (luciferase family)